MDRLKLAQFNNISNSSNNQGYLFLKNSNINVNSRIIEAECQHDYEQISRAGYTYLHFAAKNLDLASINELIRRNADLVTQGTRDGNTPLHIVTGGFKKRKESFFDEKIVKYVGKLKEDKFVKTLLSAQVQSGAVSNPKSKTGLSHLHIACMYNHIAAVELFLNAGESCDHATNDKNPLPGYTALHFAVRYSAFEAAELLLKHGADMHLKDLAGKSALHFTIERLMDIAIFLETGKRSFCPFYERERELLESIIQVFLKSTTVKDILDDTGLTLLHVTCILNDSTAMNNCLKEDVDVNAAVNIDSKLWPGWTPLHFAACFNIEIFKLLLRRGADLTVKNTKEETPLDLCMQRRSPHIVQSILSKTDEFKNILLTDGSSKLSETLLLMCNANFFDEWLGSLEDADIKIPFDSPIWPGYNPLHLAVLNERTKLSKTEMTFEAGLFGSFYLRSENPRLESVLLNYWSRVMNCLFAKRFNFESMQNADGLTPLFLAFKLHKTASVDEILSNIEDNEVDSNGLSYFNIACAAGNMTAVENLVDKKNLNEPVKCDFEWYTNNSSKELVHVPASSTPLHIAVITKNIELVKYLLEKGADLHVKDKHGIDPIHLTLIIIKNHYDSDFTKLFLDKLIESKDFSAQDDISSLHIAAICNYGKAIEKILQKGVSTETCFEPTNPKLRTRFSDDIGKTALQIAAAHRSREAVEALAKGGADIFSASGKLLHGIIGAEYHTEEIFVSKLKRKNRYTVKPINDAGFTMLHMACEKYDVKWVRALLKRKADPNCPLVSVNSMMSHWHGSTPFGIAVYKVCEGIKEHAAALETIELLIEHGADVTTKIDEGKTPIHALYHGANENYLIYSSHEPYCENMMSTIEVLLKGQKTYEVNPVDTYGLSHFHLACNRNQLDIVKKFLECGVDVNHAYDPFAKAKHHAGYTPLHFALERKNVDVARLLIEHGANVNVEDLRGDTPLHLAVKQGVVDAELIRLILQHGGDINAKNVKGMAPIEYLLISEAFTLQQFNVMMDHGAIIDLISDKPSGSGTLGLAILNAEPNNRSNVFKRMLNSWDIKNVIKQGGNAIESAVNVEQKGQLTVDFYVNVIEQLLDAGCDVDQQDSEGKTALHRATSLYNHEAVKALLLAGANLNVLDKNGESSLTKGVINDKKNDRRTLTLNLLASQVWKMRNIGLNVNESTKRAAFQVINQFSSSGNLINFDLIRKSCLRELCKARASFIYKLNLENFLSDSDAVIKYARLPVAEREAVDAFFNYRENIRQGFPEWAGFLIMQYRKAVARTKMLEPAMRVVFEEGIKLPALCLAEIVQHLNYDELKLLVNKS